MHVADIEYLYGYNQWANHRTIESVRQLNENQFTKNLSSSFGSVRDTLVHILTGEWIWLERWLGNSPKAVLNPEDFPDLESIEKQLGKVEFKREEFLDKLTEEDLDRVISYVNTGRETGEFSLGHMLQHLINHSTYHRGQVATLLRQLGVAPSPTDFLWFVNEN